MWILSSVPAGSKSSPLVASAKGSGEGRDIHQIIKMKNELQGYYGLLWSESHNTTVFNPFEVIHANVITHAYGIMHRAFHLYNILPHRKDAYTKSEQKLREIFV